MTTVNKPAIERRYPPKILMPLANGLMRRLLRKPGAKVQRGLMLLELTGRRSGKEIQTPVARQVIDGQVAALTNSGWRHNFRGSYPCALWLDGVRRPATGELVDDVATVTRVYAEKIRELGLKDATRLGIKINVDREPTPDEITEAVSRYGLSYVRFSLRD